MKTLIRKMPFIYLVMLGLSLTAVSFTAKSSPIEEFRVGYFSSPLHIYKPESATETGPAVDYVRDITSKMGVKKIHFIEEPVARLQQSLELGTIHMIMALGKNPVRAEKFIFLDSPFFSMEPAIAVLKSSTLQKISSLEDMLPLTIGIYAGGFLSPMMRDNRLKLDPLSGSDVMWRNYQRMKFNRLDALYTPDFYEVLGNSQQLKFESEIRIIKLPEAPVGLYNVFSKVNVPESFIKKYSDITKTLNYKQYIEKHIRE